MIVSGVLRTRKETVQNPWTTNITSMFRETLARNCIFKILLVILFDDRTKGINADQQTN
jgi:hypothetical protein